MNCKECGYELTEEMNFCPKCGTRQGEEKQLTGDEIDARVEKLCAEFLDWAKDWMEENPNGSVYSEYARGLLEEMNAEDEVPYICCDVLDNREEGYAITDGGFYFLESGVFSSTDYAYSFDELGEAKIKYDDGLIYIDDDCVNIGLSDEEAKKLYKLLKTISRMYEPEDDED